MTYIIGLNFFGINSIISDIRVTYKNGKKVTGGSNTLLKTGELFPGCLYGIVGNVANALKFILSTKQSLNLTPEETVVGLWQKFGKFVSKYQFPPENIEDGEHFQVLLSSNASGKPLFYEIDTREGGGLALCYGNWIRLGSGREILDKMIDQDYQHRIDQILNQVKDKPNANILAPYLICLWLTELTQSEEQKKLENIGVGGIFHFIIQRENCSQYPLPALYILREADLQNGQIKYWQYRVCYVPPWLVIDTLIPPLVLKDSPKGKRDRVALLDETALPAKKGNWELKKLDKKLEGILSEQISQQPFYFFLGVGNTKPENRKDQLFLMSSEQDKLFSPRDISSGVLEKMFFLNPKYQL